MHKEDGSSQKLRRIPVPNINHAASWRVADWATEEMIVYVDSLSENEDELAATRNFCRRYGLFVEDV